MGIERLYFEGGVGRVDNVRGNGGRVVVQWWHVGALVAATRSALVYTLAT